VDWDDLGKTVRYSVRFLDNVIDKTPYHFPENKENQQGERRVGLGTMGLAELMIKLEVRYGSPESLVFLDKIYGFMAKEAYIASAEIAAEKGSFKHYIYDKFMKSGFMKNIVSEFPEVGAAIKKNGMRNVTVITQAPTGSTGTMVGTSTGIEPYFAFEYYRQSRLGYDKQLVPIAQEWKDKNPGQDLPEWFVTSMDLSAKDHIRAQAEIQRWVDSSISKTANCPSDFTVEETKELYEMAFDLGCKGVTIYRDGSRDVQVLSTKKDEGKKEEAAAPAAEATNEADAIETISASLPIKATPQQQEVFDKQYRSRPQVLRGATYKFNTPFGIAYITINDANGTASEIFLNVGKAGSDVFAMSEALGRVISLFLRYGDHGSKTELLIKHLKGIGGSGAVGFGPNRVESIADAVAKALEIHKENSEASGIYEDSANHLVTATQEIAEEAPAPEAPVMKKLKIASSTDLCPGCGSASLVNSEGCKTCTTCGYSKCS
jgi:ribonucleoside-diphosphate reductase alpha chain